MFKPYLHIERFGNDEVEGIELGQTYIYPKLDGTNSSLWFSDGFILAGSRTRQLSLTADNQGFYQAVIDDIRYRDFFSKYPTLRLYGEWLIPHTFKGYREEAWRKLYVFDVYNDETNQYLTYEDYQSRLQEFNVDYIPPQVIIRNGTYESFQRCLNENYFLCKDGEIGEGIVLKNYDYYNKYHRQIWAKIVRQEFKEEHIRTMGAPEVSFGKLNEEKILDQTLSLHLINKTYDKIKSESNGWSSKYIPELFGRVFHDIVTEELWDSLKEINYGTVNFKTLKALTIQKIKQMKPELF